MPRLTPALAALALAAAASSADAQVTVRVGAAAAVQARSVALTLDGSIEADGSFDTSGSTVTFTNADGSGGVALRDGLAVRLTSADTFAGTSIQGRAQLDGPLRIRVAPDTDIAEGDAFTVLTCAGGCSGTFATVESEYAFEVAYGESSVTATALEGFSTLGEAGPEPPDALPDVFALAAPFPNPTRGALSVPLDLPEAAEVTVEAFDLLGRRVAVLHAGPLAAGSHTLRWAPAGLSAGTYVLRARRGASEAAAMQRVMLLR